MTTDDTTPPEEPTATGAHAPDHVEPSTDDAAGEDPSTDEDGTEGHRLYAKNVGADFDDEAGPADDDEATPQSTDQHDDDDEDGTEGHRVYAKNVGATFA